MNFELITTPEMNIPMVLNSAPAAKENLTPLLDFIYKHHSEIIKQLHQYGAVLFRGFACHNADYFSKVIESCNLGSRCSTRDYGIARTLLPNEIYTSSDLPANIPLPLHHEKPRTKNPPNHIYFCCVTPAEQGGATIFAHAGAVWLDMPQTIKDKITEHGILYKQFYPGKSIGHSVLKSILKSSYAPSWTKYYGTENKLQIEEQLAENKVNWKWINGGNDLVVLNYLPGAVAHPITHQPLWFNSAGYLNYYSNLPYDKLSDLRSYKYLVNRYLIAKDRLPLVCHYGNGMAFSSVEISEINRVLKQHSYPLNWQAGDFMIVDNFTFMHGKEAHTGVRLLYSCMTMA